MKHTLTMTFSEQTTYILPT